MLEYLPEEKRKKLNIPPIMDFLVKKKLSRKDRQTLKANLKAFQKQLGLSDEEIKLILAESHDEIIDLSGFDYHKIKSFYTSGIKIEFEFLSPYASEYGLSAVKLRNKEKIGVAIGLFFKKLFPRAEHYMLFDDYNSRNDCGTRRITTLLKKERYNVNVLLERDKVGPARIFMQSLINNGLAKQKKDGRVYLKKPFFQLRDSKGYYKCPLLDAATFAHPRNLKIVHVIGLPFSYKGQQKRVREILKAVGKEKILNQYFNIFFHPSADPKLIVKMLEEKVAIKSKAA